MREFFKKTILMIASFMFLGIGLTANCLAMENNNGGFDKDVYFTSEIYFSSKFSENITGTASIKKLRNLFEPEYSGEINDWTGDNYTAKSSTSLDNFYLEFSRHNVSAGAGFKTFGEREGLVSALQDIEYQFLPVDATSPLSLKSIGVPGVWGKYFFNPDTYLKFVGYETLWSKISPGAVPDLKNIKLNNPTEDQGYSIFSSFGTRIYDTAIEVGFSRGWGSWPSKQREAKSQFSPNPYKLSAAYFKVRKHFGSWALGGTSLVKDNEENAGSVYNMIFSVDKKLSLWGKPVSIGASYFYVQSFEQSEHLRTSPWEDLGNSLSFKATIDDKDQHIRQGFESVLNYEEHGYYFMGYTEKRISNLVKVRTQMDFVYDKQKYISDEYDSIRITGFVSYTF